MVVCSTEDSLFSSFTHATTWFYSKSWKMKRARKTMWRLSFFSPALMARASFTSLARFCPGLIPSWNTWRYLSSMRAEMSRSRDSTRTCWVGSTTPSTFAGLNSKPTTPFRQTRSCRPYLTTLASEMLSWRSPNSSLAFLSCSTTPTSQALSI